MPDSIKEIIVIRMDSVKPSIPEFWYLQTHDLNDSSCQFWDSYLHTHCILIKKQPYAENPFRA